MRFIPGLPVNFLAVMGLLFFLPPLVVILFKLKFRIGCRRAVGRVIRIEKNYDPDSESTRIQPVIEFTDENGLRTEVKTGVGYGLKYMPRLDQAVKLYYRPGAAPPKFQAASRGLWEVAGILMAFGMLLMLPAILRCLLLRGVSY